MILPDQSIRTGLVEALAAVSHSGTPVEIAASIIPPNAGYPRIALKTISSTQRGAKDCFMFDTIVSIEISDRRRNIANENIVDEIANTIAAILVPSPQTPYFEASGFRVWNVVVSSSPVNVYNIDPYFYVDKILRLTIKTEQL